MVFDYSKLLKRIVEKYGNKTAFAKAMNLSARTLSMKLNNHWFFLQEEIKKACELLEIGAGEVQTYFFTLKSIGG